MKLKTGETLRLEVRQLIADTWDVYLYRASEYTTLEALIKDFAYWQDLVVSSRGPDRGMGVYRQGELLRAFHLLPPKGSAQERLIYAADVLNFIAEGSSAYRVIEEAK